VQRTKAATIEPFYHGNYGFAGIAAGSYPISFSKAGYMPFNTVLNVVDPNTPTALNVQLTPAP